MRIQYWILGIGLIMGCRNETMIGGISAELATDAGPDGHLSIGSDAAANGVDSGSVVALPLNATNACDVPTASNGCPSVFPLNHSPCTLPAGQVCDITVGLEQNSFVCAAANSGKVWNFLEFASRLIDCPARLPADGAACNVQGLGCRYTKPLSCACDSDTHYQGAREIGCNCDTRTSTWKCSYLKWPTQTPPPFDINTCVQPTPASLLPTTIDRNKVIASATAQEVTAWCSWAVDTQRATRGFPPSQPPVVKDGFGSGYGGVFCNQPVQFCLAHVPVSECVRLLTRKACGATIGQLTECFETGMNSCNVKGQGCAAMATDPLCHETYTQIQAWDSTNPECRIPQN